MEHRGPDTGTRAVVLSGTRVTGSLLRSPCGSGCGELRRSRRLIFDAVDFFCEQRGHDAQGGNFPLHAYDIEFPLSENLENVLHRHVVLTWMD